MKIVRQRTQPDAPEDGLVWIDTGTAKIHERIAGLHAWAMLTPADLASKLGVSSVEVLSVDEIIAAVSDLNVSLRVANGDLQIVGREAVPDSLVAEIAAHEAELIAVLPEATLQQPRRWFRTNWRSWLDGPAWDDEL